MSWVLSFCVSKSDSSCLNQIIIIPENIGRKCFIMYHIYVLEAMDYVIYVINISSYIFLVSMFILSNAAIYNIYISNIELWYPLIIMWEYLSTDMDD